MVAASPAQQDLFGNETEPLEVEVTVYWVEYLEPNNVWYRTLKVHEMHSEIDAHKAAQVLSQRSARAYRVSSNKNEQYATLNMYVGGCPVAQKSRRY